MTPQNPIGGEDIWGRIFGYAVQFHASGRVSEAGSLFGAILEHHRDHLPSLQRLAAIRRQQGRPEESLELLERAVRAWPESAESHNSLGNTLNALGRTPEAIEHYRAAAALRAPFPEALLNLANALSGVERFEEAVAAYRAAIEARPEYADAHNGLGFVLDRLNRPAEALDSFAAAVGFDPGVKRGYNNLAVTLADLNRHEEALPFFVQARRLEPEAPEVIFNEALVHLALGDFERGLPQYEARWFTADFQGARQTFEQPQWDGHSDLAGKTIFLYAEQGLGDTILFVRYAELVAARGANVLLAAQAGLARLLRGLPGVAQVLTAGDPLPAFDCHLPLGSLPLAFRTTVETIPVRTPYLYPPAISAASGAAAPVPSRLRVGLCWAGNSSNRNDRNRSIPFPLFEALLETPGIEFVCLHKDLSPGEADALARYANVDRTAAGLMQNLTDTASVVAGLDLIVSVDTAMAHLAGALNRPVWVLTGFRPYWVWLRGRSESPWYPSARVFRQTGFGDWRSVIEGVSGELREWAKTTAARDSRR